MSDVASFDTPEAAAAHVAVRVTPGDRVLVKGSRGCEWSEPWRLSSPPRAGGARAVLTLLAGLSRYHTAFNVFRYITFRTAMALLTALLVSLVLGPWVIRTLRARQVGEKIRVEGPERHQAKAGTPTMGGLPDPRRPPLSCLLWGNLGNRWVWAASPSR